MVATSADLTTDAVVVKIGEETFSPLFSHWTASKFILSPNVRIRKPITGFASVCAGMEHRQLGAPDGLALKFHKPIKAPDAPGVMGVQVVPPSIVISMPPVPTRRFTKALTSRARDASVIDIRHVALLAVAVSEVDELLALSIPG
jgi:hypothetical protein